MGALTTAECIHILENSTLQSRFFSPEAMTAAYTIALGALREKAEQEQPRPLTADELEQMDGQPVWVEFGYGESGWAIVEQISPLAGFVLHGLNEDEPDPDFLNMEYNDPDGHHGLHLLGWRAYRNKPPGYEAPAQEGGSTT